MWGGIITSDVIERQINQAENIPPLHSSFLHSDKVSVVCRARLWNNQTSMQLNCSTPMPLFKYILEIPEEWFGWLSHFSLACLYWKSNATISKETVIANVNKSYQIMLVCKSVYNIVLCTWLEVEVPKGLPLQLWFKHPWKRWQGVKGNNLAECQELSPQVTIFGR